MGEGEDAGLDEEDSGGGRNVEKLVVRSFLTITSSGYQLYVCRASFSSTCLSRALSRRPFTLPFLPYRLPPWWHPTQAYYILDELFIGGQLQESSKNEVLRVSVRCSGLCTRFSSGNLLFLTRLLSCHLSPGVLADGRVDGGTEGR